jgi:protein involved in polysaccharide export with SLBB domain
MSPRFLGVVLAVLFLAMESSQSFAVEGAGSTGAPSGETGGVGGGSSFGATSESTPGRSLDQVLMPGELPLAGAIDPRVYIVGPGDLLFLQLSGEITRSVPLEVDPEGQIILPGSGAYAAAGRSLADVRETILARLRGQYRNVVLDVRLGRMRTFRVYLTGEIKVPGPVVVNGSMRAGDVLRPDILTGDASTRRIELIRRDGSRTLCDLELLLNVGDNSFNPYLQDGDVVHVPRAIGFIYAAGALARPGRFEYGERDSLSTLLRLAGDVLPAAQLDSLVLVRFENARPLDTLRVSHSSVGARINNPQLSEGSRLYVYFKPRYNEQHQVAVYGQVVRPGLYPIREGVTRMSDLVREAGGFLSGSEKSSIRVHRESSGGQDKDPELERLLRLSRDQLTASEYVVLRTKLASMREDYRVDWARLAEDKDLDLLLRDGDIVRVERQVLAIRIDGEVRRPGIVNFMQGGDIRHYIEEAGGFTSRAWREKVRVTRAVTGQTLLARNVTALDAGDFIWVPERNDLTGWEQSARLLTTLAQIATIIIAIRTIQ